MPVLLQSLSKKTGVDFRCNAALEDEVLFVTVKDAPIRELMDEIAQVTHASWEKADGGFFLRRTPKQEAQDAKADIAVNAAQLRKGLAKAIASGRQGAWTPERAKANFERLAELNKKLGSAQLTPAIAMPLYEEQRGRGVGERGMNRVLAAIDLSIFADQLPWQRRSYVLSPNQFQWKLPTAATTTLKDFLSEEHALDAQIAGLDNAARRDAAQELGRYGLRLTPVGDSANVMVTTNMIGAQFMEIRVLFYDDAGGLIDLGSKLVDLSPEPDLTALDGLATWGKTVVTMPDAAVGWMAAPGRRGPVSPDELALVSHPVLHDPLGIAFDQPLAGLAKASNLDIIAALPDDCLREMLKESCTLADFCTRLGRWESFRMDKGRLLMSPLRRGSAYTLRARRKPLEGLFATVARHIPTLDDTSAYVLAQRDGAAVSGIEGVLFEWNRCTRMQYEAMMGVDSDVSGYRSRLKFYGLLSAHEKDQMADEGIPYRNLTAAEKALVTQWIYSGETNLFVILDPAEQEAIRRHGELGEMSIFDRDPVYMMPRGIPDDALVTLKVVQTRAAHVITPAGWRGIEECIELGYILYQQEKGEFLDPNMGYPNVANSKMAPAWQRQLNFTLQFSRQVSDRFSLADSTLVNSNYGPYSQLPPEWLKPLTDTLERYKKYFREAPAQKESPPPPGQ